jgi:hypothetical protein
MSEEERVTIAVDRAVHRELVFTQPYGENLRDWASYVISEGLHEVEAQREEDS